MIHFIVTLLLKERYFALFTIVWPVTEVCCAHGWHLGNVCGMNGSLFTKTPPRSHLSSSLTYIDHSWEVERMYRALWTARTEVMMRPRIRVWKSPKEIFLSLRNNIYFPILIFPRSNCHSAWNIVGALKGNVAPRKIEHFQSENEECAWSLGT